MKMIVPRTCTEIEEKHREKEPRPLEAFRDVPAYVLLGDPGAGKTTAFEVECEQLGEEACRITARDFLTFDPQQRPKWRDKTLFIDGLDEVRVGSSDAHTPFDDIRCRLDKLGKPRFRLSCREADWLGKDDQQHLEDVSPDSKVTILRLNPLTDSDIAAILNARLHGDASWAFVAEAEERGIDGLLANPQTLNMLADVVAQGGEWPDSRKETFEMACEQMVREHQVARASSKPTPAQLLDAAGRLCAVQLISGGAGYTLHGQSSEEYLTLDQCDYDSLEMLRSALTTKLFMGVSNNRFTPIHRHIAEFLGARHLAKVIKGGLPARRVIALIAGEDGAVVTEMRGLSAWLAAHCQDARADLIERDPVGVGLYGDIRAFFPDEKRALLNSLRRESSQLSSTWGLPTAFSALATPDMETVLSKILTDDNRDPDHQNLSKFVLSVLKEGTPLPDLADLLLKIVRDDTRWPNVNYVALGAFIHNQPDDPDKTDKLKALLADIQSGSLADPNDELLGILLTQLYPQHLPPSEVFKYLAAPKNKIFLGQYHRFWNTHLLDKSSDAQVAELLDNLNGSLLSLHVIEVLALNDLLARGLQAHGEQLAPERLYDWLGVGLESGHWDSGYRQEISTWLEQRPERQKAVLEEGLNRCHEPYEFITQVLPRLGRVSPSDLGFWYLKKSRDLVNTKPDLAKHLLQLAFHAYTDPKVNEGLSLEVLKEHAQKYPVLNQRLAKLLNAPSTESIESEWQEQEARYAEKEKAEQEKKLAYIRSNETALRENRAAPELLYHLANAYFQHLFKGRDNDDAGPKAIAEWLCDDRRLIDAGLAALRGAIDREDVPGATEIINLHKEGSQYYLGLPFLAGLAELERTTPKENPSRMRKALAFYFCTPLQLYQPQWYGRLLKEHPKIVAEIQVQFAASEFRSGREHIYGLDRLAHDPDHAQVAQRASLPLLKSFPTRCKQTQLKALDHLLWAALQHADRTSLRKLIDSKRSRKSMNDAQRVHWLVAGALVAPREYEKHLKNFVENRERRVRQVIAFFDNNDGGKQKPFDELKTPESKEIFIRLIGAYVGPEQQPTKGGITLEAQAVYGVFDLIQRLAASDSEDASDSLDRLCSNPNLKSWDDELSQARENQRKVRRDASYLHPSTKQICQTLNGGAPANAADLAALVMDRLCELANKIRTGNTDDWRQHWNEPSNGDPTPKHEDHCRDALLSDLRQRLPQGIDAQPEGQYANDKRADMRISGGTFQVPVEIKKNSHPHLWSALHNQLIARYTTDPDTDGYGIYLVFWFGKDRTTPPSGTRPANAQELKEQLEATLSCEQARKISICVINVSRPNN